MNIMRTLFSFAILRLKITTHRTNADMRKIQLTYIIYYIYKTLNVIKKLYQYRRQKIST